MPCARTSGEFAGKSPAPDIFGLPGNGTDTVIVTGFGPCLWRCTQPRNPQPAQSVIPRSSATVRTRAIPCWLQDAYSLPEHFNERHTWATSKHNRLQRLHVIPKRCVGGRRAASYTTGKTTRGGSGLPEGPKVWILPTSQGLRFKRQPNRVLAWRREP